MAALLLRYGAQRTDTTEADPPNIVPHKPRSACKLGGIFAERCFLGGRAVFRLLAGLYL